MSGTAWDTKDSLYDAINDHDLRRVVEYYSPAAVLVNPTGVAEGREQIAWFYDHLFKGFPDVRITPWYKVPYDDPAITEWTLTGTLTGPFLLPSGVEVEGTGRHVAVRGACAAYVEDGMVVTHREYYDQLELYSQIGFRLMPEPVA
ncbi:MAG: ester cyclase [Actinomadura sp.]